MAMNTQGDMYNSKVADYGKVYDKLQAVFDQHGIKCVVNPAFMSKNTQYIIKTWTNITNRSRQ